MAELASQPSLHIHVCSMQELAATVTEINMIAMHESVAKTQQLVVYSNHK